MVSHGDHLSLECETRYEPAFNNTPITCNNGTWSQMPQCQPGNEKIHYLILSLTAVKFIQQIVFNTCESMKILEFVLIDEAPLQIMYMS